MAAHLIFIILHALFGVIAFFAGWTNIQGLNEKQPTRLVWIYLASLVGMVVFMAGAIAADWVRHADGQLYIFLGLFFLGIFMLYRAYRAYQVLERRGRGWRMSYVDHLGFTLISLFDGFVIVSAIDLGAPVWGIVFIAVTGVLAGIYTINRTKAGLNADFESGGA